MDVIKLLGSSVLFSTLNKRILWRIANLTQERHFAQGEYLIHEGEEADYCYIIVAGRVQIIREVGLTQPLFIGEAGQGEILGELALIDGLPRSASVIAIEPTDTLALSDWDFKAQLQAYPEIALQLLPVLARRLRQAQDQLIKTGS